MYFIYKNLFLDILSKPGLLDRCVEWTSGLYGTGK